MATRVKTVKILLSYSISHRSVADNNTKLSVNSLFYIYCNRLGHLWVSVYLML